MKYLYKSLHQPKAVATHCHAHSLSLAVKDVTAQCKLLKDAMGTAGEMAILVKFSPKRETILGDIKENIERQHEDSEEDLFKADSLSKLSTTRWTVRADCFRRIIDNYASLYQLWLSCLSQSLETDIKSRVTGCKSQMEKFEFYFALQLSHKLYALTDNLSKTLQSHKMSALSGKRNAELTKKTIETMRNDESFVLFYETTVRKAEKYDFIQEPILSRKRKEPNYSILQYLDGNASGVANCTHATTQDHFRIIYFEAIDCMIMALSERFNKPCFDVFANMETLLLKSISGEEINDELVWMHSKYTDDVDVSALKTELLVFKQIFKQKVNHFDDSLKAMEETTSDTRLLFPNVMIVIQLLLINPATSATPERSFSVARRIKTWLRSSMTPSRFNALSFLHTHKDLVDGLDVIIVANDFVSLNSVRYNNFGTFTKSDLQL